MLRLIGLGFCLLLAAPQDPVDKVKALIEKLGSDDIEVRAAAQKELAIVGRQALPALHKTLASASGEHKQQLQSMIEQVTAFGTPPLITLEAQDRPLREIAGDLERQTGIPVRIDGSIAEVKVSVAARRATIWKVVEDLCRARGELMYRFADDQVKLHPSKFRALPTVDAGGLRFFVDRFIWERGHLGPGHFRLHGGLLTAPGARVLWVEVKVDELTDDKGKNLALLPEGGGYFIPDGDRCLPASDRFIFPVSFRPAIQGTPGLDAAKLSRFRGTVDLRLAAGERLRASIQDPLARPSTPPGAGPTVLGITKWTRQDGDLRMQLVTAWGAEATQALDQKVSLGFYLRLKGGKWLPSMSAHLGDFHGEGKVRSEMELWFDLPDEAVVESLDLVAPEPVIKMEIPFDFRDIPLR